MKMVHPRLLRLFAQSQISRRAILKANNVYATHVRQYAEAQEGMSLFPVPDLKDTMEKFVNTCKPHLDPNELKEQIKICEQFVCEDACKLQEMLQERAKNTENWLSDWWMKAAYLGYRNSVIGWSSPGTPFACTKFKTESDFLCYAADVVLGALAFKKKLDEREIKQEKMGKQLLDMQQYYKVLGTCRIPGAKLDCIQYNPDSTHFVVISNNNFYKIDAYDENKCSLSRKQLVKQLESLYIHSKSCDAPAVGILTGTHRDTWAKNYEELCKIPCNTACLKYIQTSLFVLCLDKPLPNDYDYNDLTMAGMQTIHGGGSCYNAGNRWFDKCVQFVVSRDGMNGITYEHSPAEGGPVTSMGDFIQDFIAKDAGVDIKDANLKDPIPRILPFCVDETTAAAIEAAKLEVNKFVLNFDLKVFKYDSYGKSFIKEQKMSPDSYIQMAMQFAYYRLHKQPAAHYESASLRKFLHGRTETIRSCSCESLAFAESMLDHDASVSQRVKNLYEAVQSHKKYTMEAINGRGIDRHLLGLKLQALEKGMTPHPFYQSQGFVKSSSFMLSTSQVPTKYEGFMGYGPSEVDGYGICYNPRNDDIIFAVSSFKDSKKANTCKMVEALTESLDDMMDTLCKCQKAKL